MVKIYIEECKEFVFVFVDFKDGSVLWWMDGNVGYFWVMGFVKEVYFFVFLRV